MRTFATMLKDTFNHWSEDYAPRFGAALAYYSAFSIAPMIIIAIGIAGLVFGEQAAQEGIVNEIRGTVGEPVAVAIEQMLANNRESGRTWLATIVGIVTLLIGATAVFGQLQDALNFVWKVKPKPGRGIWGFISDRFLSLTMVFGIGFLLLVSLIISATLTAIQGSFADTLPGGAIVWQVINAVVSFVIVTALFAGLFKFVPDVVVRWSDVWLGALITTVLFTFGKFLLGWYLGREGATSEFGAAGSLVVILLWVYYTSQILIFGAEFTRVYALRYGGGAKPRADAMLIQADELTRQGMQPEDAEKAPKPTSTAR